MFAPDNVNVPAPCLVNPPVPPIVPAIAVLVPSPVVRIFAPKATLVPATPASDPIVSAPVSVRLPVPVNSTLATSSIAAPSVERLPVPATFTAIDPIAPDPVSANVPAFTVVAPV